MTDSAEECAVLVLEEAGVVRQHPGAGEAEGFRLSPQQLRLWRLGKDGEPDAYGSWLEIEIEGKLEPRALEQALAALAARHEILRTSFPEAGNVPPLQVVHETGSALTATLVPSSPGRWLLRCALPALCADLQTLHNLFSEIVAAYAAVRRGQEPAGEVLPYVQFSEWQNELAEGEPDTEAAAHWRRLTREPPVSLPLERRQEGRPGFAPRKVAARLDDATAAALQTGTRGLASGPASLLCACWQVLVWRLTGQEEVVVGRTVDCRSFPELASCLGLFAKVVPIRSEVHPGFSIVRIAEQAENALQEAERWQDWFVPAADPGDTPAFPLQLELQRLPSTRRAAGASFSVVAEQACFEPFDAKLVIVQQSGGSLLELHHDVSRLRRSDIQHLLATYTTLLAQAVARPDAPVSDLALLSAAERQQLLRDLNDTTCALPAETVYDRIRHQMWQHPDRIAVVYEETALTYGALGARIGWLAARLRRAGVGAETAVAILAGRSLEMIVALLGVWGSGAAYVPLDPTQPAERLGWMLDDSRATVLISERKLAACIPDRALDIVWIDDAPSLASSEDVGPGVPLPGHTAYIIFTSGSTGRPKGVVVEHRQLANYVHGVLAALGMPEGASFATVSTVAADLGNTAIFPALAGGGCLHVISQERAGEVEGFAQYMERSLIDCLKIVPAHFEALTRHGDPERSRPRRRLVLGGEASDRRWIERLRAAAGDCRIFNHYGPTETTIGALTFPVAADRPLPDSPTLPIGRPLANVEIYLLDRWLDPAPPGIAAELYIGGAQVARGYVNRPDLTAERFVPDPFSGRPGARLYKTGDLCRYLPDHNVQFLGRVDRQMKIRGFRIEPGEIEAVLRLRYKEAVLVASGTGDSQRCVAYVVPDPGRPSPKDDLGSWLAGKLPHYMVPSAIIELDALPLTANGKVDHRALAEIREVPRDGRPRWVPPRTSSEEIVAGIWNSVLSREQIGANDNFFELGGHSLLATQVISRVREIFGVELPLRRLFEQPTVAGVAAAIEQARSAGAELGAPPIVAVERTGELPLSFAQERLWFLAQLAPEDVSYNVPAAVRLHGRLPVPVLAAALSEIVRRHEVLRTTFALSPAGAPVQVIAPPDPLPVPVVDLADLPSAAREAVAAEIAGQEAARPFDLARGPLIRVTLLHLCGEPRREEQIVLLTLHHIVSDAWSRGVLIRELAALLAAYAAGRPSPLPELPIQYADFATWQRAWLAGDVLAKQLAWWRRQLAGAPTMLELPADRAHSPVTSSRGALESFELPAELGAALTALASREGATLFMVLLTGFAALLDRSTGRRDVLVGSPVANRNRLETEGLIGFFVNSVVLRGDLSGDPPGLEALRRVREMTLGAYDHQDVPFEKLVEEMAPERDLGRSPLFQVMLVLQNVPRGTVELPGLRLEPVEVDSGAVKLDFQLTFSDTGHGLAGTCAYREDLFDRSTIQRTLGHLYTLLAGLAADPARRISDLPLLSPAEREQLAAWDRTALPAGPVPLLHELFVAQAQRTPEAVAVTFRETALTYAGLDARSSALAGQLQDLGVTADTVVGLCAERSLELMAGLLGILKAGGAYLPLDPEYPEERLAAMVEDARVPVILAQRQFAEKAPARGAQVVVLDGAWTPRLEAREAVPRSATPDSLAYVLFTSGSTGRPKGVMSSHRGIFNRLRWTQETYAIGPGDRVLQKTPLGFDVSVWELFWPLATGARLVFAEPGGHRDGSYLVRTIVDEGITLSHFVPSMLSAFLAEPDVERCTPLRRVICSGEALTPELESQFFSRLGATSLHNLYGPTEAAIDVTFWDCERDRRRGTVPIGYPVAHTGIRLVDPDGNELPVGVPGELHIGGVQVARGYLGRPSLTAERFVPDSFSGIPGARLYRTSDLARRLADGAVEYLGRLDHQVKLRGLRIELGEIEATLVAYPGIHEAVVLAQKASPDDVRLVAYVVGGEGGLPSDAELRTHLGSSLPKHMVPSFFVPLARLPLTSSGKTDRRALAALQPAPWTTNRLGPETAAMPALAEGELEAPRTPTEGALARIWGEILGVDRVGVRQSFFSLGGHSLLATRVLARVRQELGVELPLRVLFETPTIEALAAKIDIRQPQAPSSLLVPLATAGTRRPFFWVHPAGGNVLCYRELSRHLGTDQPFYALQARGIEGDEEPLDDLVEMARTYLREIRTIQPQGPYRLGGWSLGGVLAFQMARQLTAAGETVEILCLLDSFAPKRLFSRTRKFPAQVEDFIRHLAVTVPKTPLYPRQGGLRPDEGLRVAWETAVAQHLVPSGLPLTMVVRLFAVYRAHLRALSRYAPEPYPGSLILLRARDGMRPWIAPTAGWKHLAQGGVVAHRVEGGHFTLLQEPFVARVAQAIEPYLSSVA